MRHIVAFTALAFAAYLFDQGWKFWPWLLMFVVAWEYLLVRVRRSVAEWLASDSVSSKVTKGIAATIVGGLLLAAVIPILSDKERRAAEVLAAFWQEQRESDVAQERYRALLEAERAGTISPSELAILNAARHNNAIRLVTD